MNLINKLSLRLFYIFLFCGSSLSLFAQEFHTLTKQHESSGRYADTLDGIGFLMDKENNFTIEQVIDFRDSSAFRYGDIETVYEESDREPTLFDSIPTFWWHISLTNETDTTSNWILEIERRHIYEVYLVKDRKVIGKRKTGEFVNYSKRSYKLAQNIIPFQLPPDDSIELFIEQSRFSNYHNAPTIVKTARTQEQEICQRNSSWGSRFHFAFILIGGFLCIFTFSQFLLYRYYAYLYYSLYLLIGSLYFLHRYELEFGFFILLGNTVESYFKIEPPMVYMLLLLYGLFGQAFGGFKGRYKTVVKTYIQWLLCIIIAVLIIHFILVMNYDNYTIARVNRRLKIGLLLIIFPFMYILYKNGTRLSYIFLIGSSILIIGVAITFTRTFAEPLFMLTGGEFDIYSMMRVVVLFEYFFFAVALGYKTKLIQDDKNRAELQRNEAELKALRAQLNPHFIFNCLNSIKSLIGKRENEKADEYLQTFTRLARGTLELSEKNYVTLEKELEIADLYVKMEGLRFNDSFHYEVKLSESVEPEAVYVPPLIFQPYLENAIHHGLLPQTGERRLIIKIYRENDSVICLIDDTGIGRQRANELKTLQHLERTSFGTRLTQSRIDEYSKLAGADNFSVEIMDRKDEHGIAIGTQVKLTFKHQ